MSEVFSKIAKYAEQCEQLSHASNIITKYNDLCDKVAKNNKEKQQWIALPLIAEKYLTYLEENLSLIGYSDSIIEQRVKLLNDYYNFIHKNDFDNIFSAQGKFRPTILEEFLFIIFKDLVADYQQKYESKTLTSGSVKAYTNLYFKAKSFDDFICCPDVAVNKKDQDYAIYRTFDFLIQDTKQNITLQVPAVAIEAKTFIDKTMLDGIIATAEKVKNGNPYTLFISVSELYDVASDVDPAYSRIDQIYVLRKTKRKSGWQNIDPEVVKLLFNDVQKHLQRPWSDVQTKMLQDGVII